MKIDVKNVVAGKSPALARVTPLVGYLRRIVHEREVNRILELHDHLPPVDFIRAALGEMGITYKMEGLDRLDPAGRYIFASNHPFGGMDGMMLAEQVSRRFGGVRVVVNDILMNLSPLRDIFIPVNTLGRQNTGYARIYHEAFEGPLPIITFPAGLCSRRRGGVVCDSEWRGNFVKQAVATHRDVVPVFVDGRLSNFFYRLSNLRTGLGVRANIEMLWLADEMFRQRGRHFRIVAGAPIPWREFDDGMPARIHAQRVKEAAYALGK
jgi:putative hemolysin